MKITLPPFALSTAMGIAANHVSKDIAVPAINNVQVVVGPDKKVRFLATDRYQAIVVQVEAEQVEGADGCTFQVPPEMQASLSKITSRVNVAVEEGKVTVNDGGSYSAFVPPDRDYPDLLKLLRGYQVARDDTQVQGLNSTYLGLIGKSLPKDSHVQVWTRSVGASGNPVLLWTAQPKYRRRAPMPAVDVLGIIMPVRIESAQRSEAADMIDRLLA